MLETIIKQIVWLIQYIHHHPTHQKTWVGAFNVCADGLILGFYTQNHIYDSFELYLFLLCFATAIFMIFIVF